MVTRGVRIQLVAFLALALVAVSVLSARYVGLFDKVAGGSYVVTADFADSGGIFTGAEVTYRGVTVGRVDRLRLTDGGVLVDLRMHRGSQVPRDTLAVVENRSAVGEQYVDLQPRTDSRPYLTGGARIDRSDTRTPTRVDTVLLDVDRLVRSVPKDDLSTTVDELGKTFADGGTDLQRLIDSGDALTRSASEALPETTKLIQDGHTVLDSQKASGSDIRSFAADLDDLSGQLRASDTDLRTVLDRGVIASQQVNALLTENRSNLGALLTNLVTVGQVTVTRTAGIRQMFITYPDVVRGGYTVLPGDGTAHFGLQLNVSNPPSCTKGYGDTKRTDPQQTTGMPPLNTGVRCAEPRGSATSVRGAQNAPQPGTPSSSGSASSVPFDPTDQIGTAGYDAPTVVTSVPPQGADSFTWMLIGDQS
ncbi:MCE family protein [Angustibacter sp. McL0619]|uniref:MCE family protein n=1 Tax=Angustibacter sp. McL0619 TaxID=3415676 RepID=UPI003CEA0FC6